MRKALCSFLLLFAVAACGREGPTVARLAADATEPPATSTPQPTPSPPEPTPSPTPAVAATASPTSEPTPGPADWQRFDEETFSFEAPADLEDQKVQGIDSQVGEFRNARMTVNYDYGWFSGDYAKKDAPDFKDTWTRIDGRFAHVSFWRRPNAERGSDDPTKAYEYQGGVYFPEVKEGEPEAQTTKLGLWVYSHDGWDDTERIVSSIRFAD